MSTPELTHFIDGTWTPSTAGSTREVIDPATEEVVALMPHGDRQDVAAAVAATGRAAEAWAATDLGTRCALLRQWADAIEADVDGLAAAEQREMGKPLGTGRMFVHGAVASLRAAVEEAERYPFALDVAAPGGATTRILRRPLGPVGLVTPWNFPVAMLVGGLIPLLAAGNTVVIKPSERSPLSAVRLLRSCPLPPGVVGLLLGDGAVGQALVDAPELQLVHFTGSVPTGRKVAETSGRLLRRTVLELGGKDAAVVDADVDPEATAQAVAFSSFVNTGQICTSTERIYVHRDVAEPFIEALRRAAEGWTPGGDPEAPSTLGPLVDARQREIVEEHVRDAKERGAVVLTGGRTPDGPGFHYPATVLTQVDQTMKIMTEETFGPVAPVVVVDSFEEGLARAADSDFGLAATVYTSDPAHVEAAERLPVGVLWVNQWQGGGPERLYEPAKLSGSGATGASAALDAATRPMSVHLGPAA